MALTATYIDGLKPRASRYTESDGHGLTLEILPSGSKSWRYRYRHHGKLEKVSLGRYPALSLKAARAKRAEYAEMLAHGRSPARHKQETKFALAHSTTVFEFGERYFREIVVRDNKDPRQIRRYLDKEIYPRLAEKALCDVTAAELQPVVKSAKNDFVDAEAIAACRAQEHALCADQDR
jgi:hypothetical protein